MKLLSFEREGVRGFGALVEGGVIDLTGAFAAIRNLKELLGAEALDEARRYCKGRKASFELAACTLLPVIPDPSKIVCVGLNYLDHVAETGRTLGQYPVIFHRYADTLVASGQPLIRPKVSAHLDYEGELAVIIGKGGSHIAESEAMAHVAGYSCFNDATVRDWQTHTAQYGMGKNFRGSGGFGPWMTTADEIGDYRKLTLETDLNGEPVQKGALQRLAFDVPKLISYVSQAMAWRPGDVLSTGTPGGVGYRRNPPRFLKHGDVVQVTVGGIGTLTNPVVDET